MAALPHKKMVAELQARLASFDTLVDAERRAADLALRDERYVIEIFGDCEICTPLTPRSEDPAEPKKNGANG
jgi:hypothetical protein